MNLILVAAVLVLTTSAFGQVKKMSPPPRPTTVTSVPTYTSSTPQNEVTVNLGLFGGALNLGGTYIRQMTDFGFGGYLFIQSAKDKNSDTVVSGLTAFGALIKVNLIDRNSIQAYIAPGFGIAMVKDGSRVLNAVTGVYKKSDENMIGPMAKIGIIYKSSPTFKVGLERMQFSNWLNDSLNNFASPSEYYQVVGAFEF